MTEVHRQRRRRKVEIGFAVNRRRFGCPALGLESQTLVGPAADEPPHIGDDGIDVLDVLLGRVGVIHPQVALAAVLAGDPKVEADRLGVADMQIAVGFRREPGDDFRVALLGDMLGDDVADEVARRRNAAVLVLKGHGAARCGIGACDATSQFAAVRAP